MRRVNWERGSVAEFGMVSWEGRGSA